MSDFSLLRTGDGKLNRHSWELHFGGCPGALLMIRRCRGTLLMTGACRRDLVMIRKQLRRKEIPCCEISEVASKISAGQLLVREVSDDIIP